MDLTLEGRKKRIPDILDAIAALSSDAVPTPPEVARAMLDLLPEHVWTDPGLKWLDPGVKSGSILREIASRLMVGLADWEPDLNKRAEHIMTNMLHGLSITKLHGEMGRRSVYRSRDASSEKAVGRGEFFGESEGNIHFVHAEHAFKKSRRGLNTGNCLRCGAPIGLERGVDRENYAYAFIHDTALLEELKTMKFDVIVGNPPYQVGTEGHGSNASPVYHHFINSAVELDPKYVLMIVPSRWFTGGKGLGEFRNRMIADRRLRAIIDNPKLFDCFPGVEIKGGVNYFLWDRDHQGDCEFSIRIDGQIVETLPRDLRDGDGVLLRNPRAVKIVERVRAKMSASLAEVVSPRYPFGSTLMSNFAGAAAEPFAGSIPLIFASHIAYISPRQIERNAEWVDLWKVLLPKAGDGHGREVSYVLGEPIVVAPGSACTGTYLVAGKFDSAETATNFANYLTTRFARFMVLQRKSTQNISQDSFRFVPALDMDRPWNDEELYEHFDLTPEETKYIEASIHPREPNFSLESSIPASHVPGGSKYRPPNKRADIDPDIDEDDE
jgi:site-specific DNA-methyltransferase (adenine-specific)